MIRSILIILSLILTATASAQDEEQLRRAIDGDHRSPAEQARDTYRHPFETLTFFGVEADDTVVQMYPRNGWYTQILAPYLQDDGLLIVAHLPRQPDREGFSMNRDQTFYSRMREYPEIYRHIENMNAPLGERITFNPPGTVDAILDFRNAHGWLQNGTEPLLQSWYEALKPGGTVGIVTHRADADGPEGRGYVHEQSVIDAMEQAGFELEDRAEINANPDDTKDHPEGVWSLPPEMRNVPDNERIRYLRIGESDRMTLRFSKPE